MLHLAGTEAAGTTLWMVGPDTIAKHITPTIAAAATEAGRPSPRILAGVTVCVTDDPDAVRTRSATEQGLYASLPAYQHMMQAEGVEGPADLVIAGDEETVALGIQRYADAGATDVRVTILSGTTAERNRTRAVLRSLGS
jgi:alkanesulfonate monooxygenase SsuD/methylene tetrahydromethanopterin reductase-like flavin-dependent oxidoreductase (luciferase family)